MMHLKNCFLNLMKMLVLDVVDAMYHALMEEDIDRVIDCIKK